VGISAEKVKQLRDHTGAGMMDCKVALQEANGDFEEAITLLRKKGMAVAARKAGRAASEGVVTSYIHPGSKVGVLVEVNCETDFVARTDGFKNLAHEVVMQVAAMDPKDVNALLKQEYIRDSSKTIGTLVTETIAKVGENIVIKKFVRFELGS